MGSSSVPLRQMVQVVMFRSIPHLSRRSSRLIVRAGETASPRKGCPCGSGVSPSTRQGRCPGAQTSSSNNGRRSVWSSNIPERYPQRYPRATRPRWLTVKRRAALVSIAMSILGLATVIPLAATAASRPNVVILMSDDQRWDTITPTLTPNIWDNLVNTGPLFPDSVSTAFTDAFVPDPLCCPSRTSTLTGRYSHTTGVYANVPPYGGFASFDDTHTIATDFRSAGYQTAMIGKYLNGYNAGIEDYIPPGWDRWFAVNTGVFYNYVAQSDGVHLQYGSQPSDYATRVLSSQAVSFVQGAKAAGEPFFLYYAFTAPHAPAIPDPTDVGRFASVPLPTPPSYNVAQYP